MELGTKPQYQDDSSTPKTSPLTVSSTEIAIKVPANAKYFVYEARLAAMKIGRATAFTTGYDVILQGNGESLRCQDMEYIYVQRNASTDVELHFHFDVFV